MFAMQSKKPANSWNVMREKEFIKVPKEDIAVIIDMFFELEQADAVEVAA